MRGYYKDIFNQQADFICIDLLRWIKQPSVIFLLIAFFAFSKESYAHWDGGIDKTYCSRLKGVANTSTSSELKLDATAVLTYPVGNEINKKIKNIIKLSIIEETALYIPENFTATVSLKIEYGHSSTSVDEINRTLTVNYDKTQGVKYNAKNYISFDDAEYVKITVTAISAPLLSSGTFDTRQVLLLENEMKATRYYELSTTSGDLVPTSFTEGSTTSDALTVNWVWSTVAGNNQTQLEWTWLENELAGNYPTVSGHPDYDLLFASNATRVDLPLDKLTYDIPLFYDGQGKLYYRIRAVNVKGTGNRSDGPWAYPSQAFPFNGHDNNLNWQVTTSFAEEGKRKSVIQYYDGSLRSRQTVTKDNVTGTTVIAETMYDGQGRAAIQILPVPGISNIVSYTKNLHLFNDQNANENPAKYFDFEVIAAPNSQTPLLQTVSGAARYYSASNDELNNGSNKNIPDAQGYPYTVTRYTPDATGRIMSQSGVGAAMKMGSGHETKYYYGTAAKEELDGLFGTEAGNNTHYFKNMVKDANGQMSLSYVDMHGRNVATALAGDNPTNLLALNLNSTDYPNQSLSNSITKNLLDYTSNTIKGNSVESINTILVPATTAYNFAYQLNPQALQAWQCVGANLCYDCMYNLEISITDESGDQIPIVRKFNNVSLNADDNCRTGVAAFKNEQTNVTSNTINFSETLQPGSYSIRKTLTISESSLQRYKEIYLPKALCKTKEQLIDSVFNVMSELTHCGDEKTPPDCEACITALGTAPTDPELLASYNESLANCKMLCSGKSHKLETIRKLMLADMIPYSGQYAKETAPSSGSTTMHSKYNIFSTVNTSTQPFYKYPLKADKSAGLYKTSTGLTDLTIHPGGTGAVTASQADFNILFSNSWANSLLPHHPEYDKLVWAENHLTTSYDWIDQFNNVNTYAEAVTNNYILTQGNTTASPYNDPFFTVASSKLSIIEGFVKTEYYEKLSLWQIAYGNVKCKNLGTQSQVENCYKTTAPKQPNSTYSSLSTADKNAIWNNFKGLYSGIRDSLVNGYINEQVSLSDVADLINQNYFLHFTEGAGQLAQQLAWTWFPSTPGDPPAGINMATLGATEYAGRCSSQIAAWKNSLLQCVALNTLTPTVKDQILNEITTGMVAVCERGTDEANPYGASNVPPNTPTSVTVRSFEDVINSVFTSHGINRDIYCNPFVIEFPKPYNKGPKYTSANVTIINPCTYNQYNQAKQQAFLAEYDTTSLVSLNEFFSEKYHDTLSTALYQQLQNYDSTVQANQPVYQTEPSVDFLACGYNLYPTCYTCGMMSILVEEFKDKFSSPLNTAPIFTGDLSTNQLNYNILFQRFMNYRTGFQYTWLDYSKMAQAASCNLANYASNGSATQRVICKDPLPLNDSTDVFIHDGPCKRTYDMAVALATNIYEARQEELLTNFETAYRNKCLAAKDIEQFSVQHINKEYHYTLYYYDQAGNLVKTVPPKGVHPDFSSTFITAVETNRKDMQDGFSWTPQTPSHTFVTDYRYNSLNQVIAQRTPDAGTSKFWYDRLGRLVVSQNAEQYQHNKWSYTLYDDLGRIAEVGQKPQGTAMTQVISQNESDLDAWITVNGGTREQITYTIYDLAYAAFAGTYLDQQNLRNRVSYSATKALETDNFYSASFYSYDIHGNVETLVQDYRGVAAMSGNNRYKRVEYDYDLVSGKVNMVSYQPRYYDNVTDKWVTNPDAFYHKYAYDGENRITEAYTSRDKIIWERDAKYEYYKHGPLSRTIIGQQQVQGLDYSYTLQGWLKGINPVFGGALSNADGTNCSAGTAMDDLIVNSRVNNNPSQYKARNSITFEEGFESANADEFETELNTSLLTCNNPVNSLPFANETSPVARDVYGFSLHYYTEDYKPIGLTSTTTGILGALGSNGAYLYNGNIAGMAVNIPKLGSAKVYSYRYDQLNRLKQMDAFNGLNISTGTFIPVSLNDYKERVSYDPNGNITTYERNGTGTTTSLNNFSYSYANGNNQLTSIHNSINNTTSNYEYDAIGNATKDTKQEVTANTWNVYGKLQTVQKTDGTVITYTYDAAGNRITKTVAPTTGSNTTEVYVRDAAGNLMSMYKKESTTNIRQTEIDIYGSSMLGSIGELTVATQAIALTSGFEDAIVSTYTRGEKAYILTDHRSNNMVSISDKKIQIQDANSPLEVGGYEPDIQTASYYSAYGAISNAYNSNEIKLAHNGQRRSTEISATAQTALFWEYDGDVGKRWNVDPKPTSGISPYSVMFGNPIWCKDVCGDTPTVHQAAQMSADAYNKYEDRREIEGGWERLKTYNGVDFQDPRTDFQGALYSRTNPSNGKTEYTFATAGTASGKDAWQDVIQAVGASGQYAFSIQQAKKLDILLLGQELTFTGHSLGGGTASANSLATGNAAITFNAAGISLGTKFREGLLSKSPASVQAFIIPGEAVDYYQDAIGSTAEGKHTYVHPWFGKMNSVTAKIVKESPQTIIIRAKLHMMSSMYNALGEAGYGTGGDGKRVVPLVPFVPPPPRRKLPQDADNTINRPY